MVAGTREETVSQTLIVALSVVALIVLLGLWRGWRRFGAVLGLAHVRTFVERVDALRDAALDRFDEPLRDPDPRTTLTRAGLAVAYTITGDGDDYRHHLSVSQPGGPTTRAVGARFLLLGVRRLRVDGADDLEVGLGVSPAGVHHAEWVLDAEMQARFVDRRPPPLDDSALATVFAACLDEASRVHFERLAVERD